MKLVLLAVTAIVLGGCSVRSAPPAPLGKTLVYQLQEDGVSIDKVALVLEDRLEPALGAWARVRVKDEQIIVEVFGNDPARVDRVKRLASIGEVFSLRVVVDRQVAEHAAVIKTAEGGKNKKIGIVKDEGGTTIGAWYPVEFALLRLFEDNDQLVRRSGDKGWRSF